MMPCDLNANKLLQGWTVRT